MVTQGHSGMHGDSATPGPERVPVLGVGFDPLTVKEATARILAFVEAGRPRLVVTPNPEIVYAAQFDPELMQLLRQADLVTADGTGIVWAARQVGRPVPERVTGIELAEDVMAEAAHSGYRLFFLGAKPGVAAEAAERLTARIPGLNIVGTHDGYFTAADEPAVLAEIAAARPHILFVGLGSPKQEKWCRAHQAELGVPVAMGLGGCFDVWAGRLTRAPLLFQRLHLEWLHRLGREPRRFWRMLALPKFVLAVRRHGSKPVTPRRH